MDLGCYPILSSGFRYNISSALADCSLETQGSTERSLLPRPDVTSASPISGYLHGPVRDDETEWTSPFSAEPAFESPGFVSAR